METLRANFPLAITAAMIAGVFVIAFVAMGAKIMMAAEAEARDEARAKRAAKEAAKEEGPTVPAEDDRPAEG